MTRDLLARFARDEVGATSIEYGLIASLIAVVIVTAVSALGGATSDMYQSIADAFPS